MIALSSLKCRTLILRNTNKTLTFHSSDILLSSYIKKNLSFSFLGLSFEVWRDSDSFKNYKYVHHFLRHSTIFFGKKNNKNTKCWKKIVYRQNWDYRVINYVRGWCWFYQRFVFSFFFKIIAVLFYLWCQRHWNIN